MSSEIATQRLEPATLLSLANDGVPGRALFLNRRQRMDIRNNKTNKISEPWLLRKSKEIF